MQVLKILNARSVWLFPISDINPRGKSIGTDLIEWLKNTYRFQKYPSSEFDFNTESRTLSFEGGKFKADHDEGGHDAYISVSLAIYNDGLLANTQSSTEAADKFLTEALGAAIQEFGLSNPQTMRRKLYYNEMDVRIDKPLTLLNPKLQTIANRITELRQWDQPTTAFEFSGVSFFPEPMSQSSVASFALERKIGTDWSENRYYTRAPLKTSDHILMLNEFEQSLSG